ncbi:hypothetical protein Tco_1109946 [Tanacetum coccineum]|uniref:Uncharacterized protein n=1 Tax=Tanacetum coccineum TaxID=301880 RepID=A0ABQ5IJV3_9ASTR
MQIMRRQDTRNTIHHEGAQILEGDKLVSWSSKKQKCTAISSTEAGYIDLYGCCAQILLMRSQLTDYGFQFNKIPLCPSDDLILVKHAKCLNEPNRLNDITTSIKLKYSTIKGLIKALDDALVAPVDRLEFGKCNMRLKTATASVHKSSIRFTINKKKVSLDVDMFREILLFCPKIPGQKFEDLLLEHDILSFFRDLGHSGDIIYLTDVNGMFHKKNIDYLYLLWEYFMFHIENKDAKKTNKMSYARFTKIIIDYFMSKDQSISRRNKMFWHTARDDTMFTSMRCISRHEDTQVYGTILPKELTNQAMLESNAYKTYSAFASEGKLLKPKIIPKENQILIITKADACSSYKGFNSSDGVDTQSKVLDEQQQKSSGIDEGTGTIPGVPDVPIYESESEKESWGDRNDGDDDDANDDDKQEEEKENIDDEEMMYDDEDDEVTKELYEVVNVNLGYKYTEITNADQGASEQQNKADEPIQSSSVSFDFTSKLLNLENPSPTNNEIASLMETSARHATTVPEITSGFTTTIPPQPLFNRPSHQLGKDLSKIKQVDQYAQALSSIPAIVDLYMDNKLGEAINKAILAHNLDCKQEAQDEKNDSIKLVDTSMRALIKEEVNTQLPQILPQAVSDFANPVIEKNVTESVEAAVLTRSSLQPMSTYEAAASLSEFELTKILIDKMEKNKSYVKADYKKKLYDALVESYNTEKDLFDSYGEVFSLKRSRDEKDKDQDPFVGSD